MDEQSTTDLEQRARGVVARTFRIPLEQLGPGSRMGNPPQWDSMGHMGLVLELEREFGVRFPTYVLPELVSLPAIAGAVRRFSGGKA